MIANLFHVLGAFAALFLCFPITVWSGVSSDCGASILCAGMPLRVSGDPTFTVETEHLTNRVKPHMPLPATVTITASGRSFADLELRIGTSESPGGDNSAKVEHLRKVAPAPRIRVRVMPDSIVSLSRDPGDTSKVRAKISQGHLTFLIRDGQCEKDLIVTAGHAIVSFIRPGAFQVSADGEVMVFEGRAAILETFNALRVRFIDAGQMSKVGETNVSVISPSRSPEIENVLRALAGQM